MFDEVRKPESGRRYAAALTTRGTRTFLTGVFAGTEPRLTPLPLVLPLAAVFAIFAARSIALLFVRGAIEGGACTTLGRGFGLTALAAGGEVGFAVPPLTFEPLAGLSASALLGGGELAEVVEVEAPVAARETGGRLTDVAEAGLVACGWSEEREEERENMAPFRTGAQIMLAEVLSVG